MTRGNVSPWFAVGLSFRRVIRKPYAEIEVYRTRDGWRWRLDRIDPGTGQFCPVADGVCDTRDAAKRAAMDAAGDLG